MAKVSITQKELAYIAGFIDGEGCLTIRISKRIKKDNISGFGQVFCASLIIVNTNKKIIDWLHKIIGGSCLKKIQPKFLIHKTSYHITLSSRKRLLPLLKKLYPYLKVKKKQAKIIISVFERRNHFRNSVGKKEINALNKIRELNRKGCH